MTRHGELHELWLHPMITYMFPKGSELDPDAGDCTRVRRDAVFLRFNSANNLQSLPSRTFNL